MRKKGFVTYSMDPTNPPPLTTKQKRELERLAAMPDESIDTSDMPELTEDFWKNAKVGLFYRPVKQQLTLRLDADVVDWFKRNAKDGKGYQTSINVALREYVRDRMKKAG